MPELTAEEIRLDESSERTKHWKRWGPYLSERQWGTIREDYSENGDAWQSFPFDHAHLRAYRWGEDGLGGICDRRQYICFALALWNGRDPILKERLFGLTGKQGNHGEDVKECYYYLDSTPTHSYMKYLYKYPQAAYPYDKLVATNRDRGREHPEYELLAHGSLRRGPLLRRLHRVRQADAGVDAHPHPRDQPRSRIGSAAPAADRLVSQHLVLEAASAATQPVARPRSQ